MDTKRWNNVLVEWVNCLSLSKRIQKIGELKNGEFFLNVQKLITKQANVRQDVLSFILQLLSERYPTHHIEDEREVHLVDLSDKDLTTITTLLLHYTCIYDRRDVLTSPLCHSLSQSTQTIIKEFLQRMDSNGDIKHTLNDIVAECLQKEYTAGIKSGGLLAATSSSDDCQSPLQNLLKTPVSKLRRFQEKDRIITRLRSELENERYERADLQDELRKLGEKCQKTEQLLSDKKSEVTRLKGQIAVLEDLSPPHYSHSDSQEQQKRLKAEIQDLEHYIQQCENDYCQVNEEKDALKVKLKTLESQCVMWQEKYFEIEQNLEALSDHSQKQESELKGLQEHCEELTAMLAEYRSSNRLSCSSTLESSDAYIGGKMNESASCENLACSVVEVQLKECQKLNEELKCKLKEAEESSLRLAEDAEVARKKLCETESAHESLLESHKQAAKKMDELKYEVFIMEQKLTDSLCQIGGLSKRLDEQECDLVKANLRCDHLSTEIDNVTNQRDASNRLNQNLRSLLDKADKELTSLRQSYDELQSNWELTKSQLGASEANNFSLTAKLNDCEKSCSILRNEICDLKTNLDETSKTKDNITNERDASNKLNQDLRSRLDKADKELVSLRQTCEELKFNWELAKSQLGASEANNFSLIAKLDDCEQSCSMLRNEICDLRTNLDDKIKKIDNVTNQRDASNKLNQDLRYLLDKADEEWASLSNKCDELKSSWELTKSQLGASEANNSSLIAKLDDCEQSCSMLRNEICDLRTNLDEKIKKIDNVTNQRDASDKLNQDLRYLLEKADEELVGLRQSCDELKSNWELTKSQLDASEADNFSLTTKLIDWEQSCSILTNEICDLRTNLNEKTKKCDLLQSERELLSEKVAELTLQCETFNNNLLALKTDRDELKHQLEQQTNDNNHLQTTCNRLIQENEMHANKVYNLEEKLANRARELSELMLNLDRITDELREIGTEREMLKAKNANLEQQILNVNSLLAEKVKLCQNLEMDNIGLKSQIAALTSQYERDLLDAKNNLDMEIAKYQELQFQYAQITHQLITVRSKGDQVALVVQDVKKMMAEEKDCIKDKIKELEKELAVCVKHVEKVTCNYLESNIQLERYKSKYEQLVTSNGELVKLHENEISSLTEITTECDTLKAEKLKLQADLIQQIQHVKSLLEEKEKQCQNLDSHSKDLVSVTDKLTQDLALSQQNLSHSLDQITTLSQRLDERERELVENQMHCTNLTNEIESITERLTSSDNLNQNLKSLLDKKHEDLSALQSTCDELKASFESTKNQLKAREIKDAASTAKWQAIEQSWSELKTETDQLRTNIVETSKECDLLKTEKQSLLEKISTLTAQLETEQMSSCNLTQSVNSLTSHLEQKDNDCQSLKEACQTLETEKEELIKKIGILEDTLKKSSSDNNELQLAKAEAVRKCESLIVKISDDELQSVESVEKLKELMAENNEKMQTENNSLALKIGILEDALKKSSAVNDELQLAKSEAVRKCESLLVKISDAELQSMESVEKLKKLMAENNEKLQAENNSLVLKIKSLESEVAGLRRLESETLQLENDKDFLFSQIEEHKSTLAAKDQMLKSLKDTVLDYEYTISGLKSVVDGNLETLAQLKEDKQCLEAQADTMSHQIATLEKYKHSWANFIANLNEKGVVCDDTDALLKLDQIVQDNNINNKKIAALTDELQQSQSALESTLKEILSKVQLLTSDGAHSAQIPGEDYAKVIVEQLEQVHRGFKQLQEDKKALVVAKLQAEFNFTEEQAKCQKLVDELKPSKGNILLPSTKMNVVEDDWKKKLRTVKQKLVLTESDKNKLEKRVKELREENAKLAEEAAKATTDAQYKMLLGEYIQLKEEHQKVTSSDTDEQMCVEIAKLNQDLQNIRQAYGNIMSDNSKLELENVSLRKIIEERNLQLSDVSRIKEAYEKLLEENNKLMTEVDTIKYKRTKDKEEFVKLLRRKIDEVHSNQSKIIQGVKTDYDSKLEKMKEKMLHLYREEVNKEIQKVKAQNLKSDLINAEQKIQLLEMERDILKTKQNIQAETDAYIRGMNRHEPDLFREVHIPERERLTSLSGRNDNLRASTLPRTTIEDFSSTRNSVPIPSGIGRDLHMEDEEEDLFNNKYLADLKEGRCTLPMIGRESNISRFSELSRRNTLVPPHLKSSYPAETQFASPGRFKDEDMKFGQVGFDDSLVKLLPGEKPRKKDFGTTSYKRPGPPTPSKNGGRLSLQGNEVHPLRDQAESKTPKRSTPSRIRALFATKSTKDTSETHNTTPKRRSFFRRPR